MLCTLVYRILLFFYYFIYNVYFIYLYIIKYVYDIMILSMYNVNKDVYDMTDLSPASASSLVLSSGVPLSISTSSTALQAAAAAAAAAGSVLPPSVPPVSGSASVFGDHHLRTPLALSAGKPLVSII